MNDLSQPPAETWDRQTLNDELFRRPPVAVSADALVVHTAFLQDEHEMARSVERLRALLSSAELARPGDDRTYEVLQFGGNLLKWERHTEFTTFTLVARAAASDPFVIDAGGILPANWMAELSGHQIAATKLRLVPQAQEQQLEAAVAALRADASSGEVADGQARIWVDCRIYDDACTRVVVADREMSDSRRARLAQRLLEIETYRMVALLGFPIARRMMGQLHELDSELRELVARVARSRSDQTLDDDEATLNELLALASEIERLSATNAFRFDASRAYYDIVQQRLEDLREQHVHGHQRLTAFIRRRLGPAMQTVIAVSGRLETLSHHINFTASLIRTRVDLGLQQQNRTLLHSMDRRAALQIRLQQTLEWLTISAMSYYGIGVVNYIATALAEAGLPINPDLTAGIAAPVVIGGAWWLVSRVRKILQENEST